MSGDRRIKLNGGPPILFVERDPNEDELEVFRLLMSVFAVGIGSQWDKRTGRYWPGWREFERIVALLVGGRAEENKGPYDVSIPLNNSDKKAGISCKVKKRDSLYKKGQVYIEISNKNTEARKAILGNKGLEEVDAQKAGERLLDFIKDEYIKEAKNMGFSPEKLAVLHMTWWTSRDDFYYRLFLWRGPMRIYHEDLSKINWEKSGKGLVGKVKTNGDEVKIVEYYPSGGHIKQYPFQKSADWVSKEYSLIRTSKTLSDFLISFIKTEFGIEVVLPKSSAH